MELREFLNDQLAEVHRMADIAMTDLTADVAHWQPPGTANTIAQLLAHMTNAEDRAIYVSIQGGTMLAQQGWAEKVGFSNERGAIWNKGWRLNLGPFFEYARQVHEAATRCVAGLSTADLDREVQWFNGPRSTGALLRGVIINHSLGHAGEISTIKGAQGLKGLPF
jgi:hypothetical protein